MNRAKFVMLFPLAQSTSSFSSLGNKACEVVLLLSIINVFSSVNACRNLKSLIQTIGDRYGINNNE